MRTSETSFLPPPQSRTCSYAVPAPWWMRSAMATAGSENFFRAHFERGGMR